MMHWLFIFVRIKRKLFEVFNGLFGKLILIMNADNIGKNVIITSVPHIYKYPGSKIILKNNVRIHGNVFNNPACSGEKMVIRTLAEDAAIIIGNDSGISCATIIAQKKVLIGDRVLIGAGVRIMDTDFHPIHVEDRNKKNHLSHVEAEEVIISDDVWLGAESMVLKGVTIGHSSVVAARSVVTKDVPPNTLVAGVPARVIRILQ